MKTTKEDRTKYLNQLILLLERNTQYWKIKMAKDIESDIDAQSAEIELLKAENAKLREAVREERERIIKEASKLTCYWLKF